MLVIVAGLPVALERVARFYSVFDADGCGEYVLGECHRAYLFSSSH